MLTFIFITIGALLLVIQTSITTMLPDWIGQPDLIFLLVIYLSSRFEVYRGAAITLLLGLTMDIYAGINPGLYPIIYLGLYAVIRLSSRHLIVNEASHQPPLAAAGYLLMSGAIYLFVTLTIPDGEVLWSWRSLLLQDIIIAVLAFPSYQVLSLVQTTFSDRRKRSLFINRSKSGNRFIQ
ncbi:MAG: rod shape-determining protein MreD [Proteobacteria bacterium]|nr:rod shape-determining protein MreD [Pseudomonadota bacterium]MBU1686001.1 rod shape-determining protein MreD [Pseudomonadota bacterium]